VTPSNPRIPFRLSTRAPRVPPPDGKPLIVHVVINLEHWPFDQPMPRALFAAPHGKQPWPDLANYSWVEYGLRMGVPRLERVLRERGLPASATMNASVIDVYPDVADLALQSRWEIIGHAVVQRSLQLEAQQQEIIARAIERLTAFTGKRPRGWLGPGFGETMETPEYLKQAGFDHIYDWPLDDLPCWLHTADGPLLAMPYAVELNDVTLFPLEKHSSDEYYKRYCDTVEMIEPELAHNPRVLTLGLHPHIIAVPHRLKHFAKTLDMLRERSDTVFMTGSQIADWFTGHVREPARDRNSTT
jgi:peptidoglycan/xylan/chitin deacetylase (PgdA/CDA1 family)